MAIKQTEKQIAIEVNAIVKKKVSHSPEKS